LMSSSAKADDPVFSKPFVHRSACVYWVPAFAGMTTREQ
jgi:hypothetical protein